MRIKNFCAFRWLVLIVGCLALASWAFWTSQVPNGEPPIIAFIALAIAIAILLDNCED